MYRALTAAVIALLLVEGCSLGSFPEGGERGKVTVSWDCVRDLEAGLQTCSKRRMRNGSPVDDEVLDSVVIPGDAAPPAESGVRHGPPAQAGDAVPWKRQPLSKINTIGETGRLEVENVGPEVPKGRETADVRDRESKPAGGDPPATEAGSSGYTLQMAAFSSPDRCELFIARDKPMDLAVHKRLIANKGKSWCIVTHGDYDSREEAAEAAKSYSRKYPQLSFWLRSWGVIRELEVTE